jgi:hypothetical protein
MASINTALSGERGGLVFTESAVRRESALQMKGMISDANLITDPRSFISYVVGCCRPPRNSHSYDEDDEMMQNSSEVASAHISVNHLKTPFNQEST